MLNMQNGAIGAWRPSFWAREARGPAARARARYLKKRAASFFTRESLEQKCENLLLMCAQWTNLGGVIFHFFGKFSEKCFEKYFPGWGKTGGGPLRLARVVGLRFQSVSKACPKRLQSVFKASSKRFQSVLYTRLPPDDCWPKMHFGRKIFWRPISPLGSFGRHRLQNCRKRCFLRQPVQGNDRAQTVRKPCASRAQTVRKPSASRAQAVRNPCANRAQTVRKPSANRAQTVRNPYRRAIRRYDWHVIGKGSACDYEVKGGGCNELDC